MRKIANPWLRHQMQQQDMQIIDLAILLGLPPKGPDWITEHVNRRRHRPHIERALARHFNLSIPQLRHRLWPRKPYRASRARPQI